MRIRHYAQGRFYVIDCPAGSRVVRGQGREDQLLVPFEGKDIAIPAEPAALLPMLAEAGRCGLSLAREPTLDPRLAGMACPLCGQDDHEWLSLDDSGDGAVCESCGHSFAAPVQSFRRSTVEEG